MTPSPQQQHADSAAHASARPRMQVRMLRMLVCFTLLMAASLFPVLLMGPALLVVFALAPRVFRQICDHFAATWIWFAVALMEKWLGLRVIATGDRMRGGGEQSLIVMNHRTRLDWLYFWALLVRQSGVRNEKIVLKSVLKHAPGAGWAMQTAGFLFLDRRWNIDEPYLDSMLDYYHSMDYKTQILLFPEGTDFDASTRARSNEYASRAGMPALQHVLHPRTTGFTHIVSHLKRKWPDAVVYDVTVAYSTRSFPQTELDILSGLFPSSVHFDVRRHALASLPGEPALIDAWCRTLWASKERRLEAFSAALSFESITSEETRAKQSAGTGVSGSAECEAKESADVDSKAADCETETSTGPECNGSTTPQNEKQEPGAVKEQKQEPGTAKELADARSNLVLTTNSAHSIDSKKRVHRCEAHSTSNHRGPDSAPGDVVTSETKINVLLYIAMAGWFTFVLVYVISFYCCALVRWASLFQALFFLVVDYRCGGFELLQARYYRWRYGVRRGGMGGTGRGKLD